ncbi:hypothetical protein, partial [Xanthomonas campestris]|uniref:hypothetical protein n=1 Tax=Xanthomonas campestris TaxID=339 RepID=UPI0025A10545
QEDLPARLLALAQALSVTERQLHGSPLNMRRVVSRICGALFRASLTRCQQRISNESLPSPIVESSIGYSVYSPS